MSERSTPKKLWFQVSPNVGAPWDGGALLHILPREGDKVTVGLDLARLLQLQVTLARTVGLVLQHSLVEAEPENPITEEEISAFRAELEQREKDTDE